MWLLSFRPRHAWASLSYAPAVLPNFLLLPTWMSQPATMLWAYASASSGVFSRHNHGVDDGPDGPPSASAAALMVAMWSGRVSKALSMCAPPGEVMKIKSEYLAAKFDAGGGSCGVDENGTAVGWLRRDPCLLELPRRHLAFVR